MEIFVEQGGQRLDLYLSEKIPHLTRSRLGELIKTGHILVNDQSVKRGLKLKQGDQILVNIPPAQPTNVKAENMQLDIYYEDEDLLVVNKAKGMVVHPAAGNPTGTLVNGLLAHCGSLSQIGGVQRPGIVHRLDKDTSGLLMVAKNDIAHNSLSQQLQTREVKREYRAIVHGHPPDSGCINAPVGRHPVDRKKMTVLPQGQGRTAVTHFQVLEEFKQYSYLACRLETGRTHQIRVHLAYINHSVIGDHVYGQKREEFKLEGQALHATILGFNHPRNGEYLEFCAPVPEDMQKVLELLRGDC